MNVTVRDIARNDAKASGPGEAVYEVETTLDGQDRTFAVRVAIEQIGTERVPCAAFRNPDEMRVFRYDQRALSDILRSVLDVYNREKAILSA